MQYQKSKGIHNIRYRYEKSKKSKIHINDDTYIKTYAKRKLKYVENYFLSFIFFGKIHNAIEYKIFMAYIHK